MPDRAEINLNFRTGLIRFLNSPARLQWIDLDKLEVYLRKGFHYVQLKGSDKPAYLRTIDLANVRILNPADQGKGYFHLLLDLLEQLVEDHAFDGIYVENVFNARVHASCTRRKYLEVPSTCLEIGVTPKSYLQLSRRFTNGQ